MHDQLAELRSAIAAGSTVAGSIAPTLAAGQNSRIRLAIGYSDGGVECDECSHGPDPNPASLRLCWVNADDASVANLDMCDCHFGDFWEMAVGDAFPLEDD